MFSLPENLSLAVEHSCILSINLVCQEILQGQILRHKHITGS